MVGFGVALGQWHLALGDLRAGRLHCDHASSLPHIVHPHVKTRKDGLRTLVDWLVANAANDQKIGVQHP